MDGFSAAEWLNQRGVTSSRVSAVCWGSPHVELANGTASGEKAGVAKIEKPRVANSLCAQFSEALVVVTYARHWLDASGFHSAHHTFVDVEVLVEPKGGKQYGPRYSTGWRRCNPTEVRAIVGFPKNRSVPQEFLGNEVNLWALLSAFAPSGKQCCLFLGEEGADLSRCAAQHHCEALAE